MKIASHKSTTFSVCTRRMIINHTYANTLHTAVIANTFNALMVRTSPLGIAITQTPVITSKLNAAEPTIVLGPSFPASKFEPMISMIDRRISGADDPRAIRVRFATVSFQTRTSTSSYSLPGPGLATFTIFTLLVIVSIAHMNTSAIIATPVKDHINATKYSMPRTTDDHSLSLNIGSNKVPSATFEQE